MQKWIPALILLAVLGACTTQTQQPKCDASQVLVGSICCFDDDKDLICDQEGQSINISRRYSSPSRIFSAEYPKGWEVFDDPAKKFVRFARNGSKNDTPAAIYIFGFPAKTMTFEELRESVRAGALEETASKIEDEQDGEYDGQKAYFVEYTFGDDIRLKSKDVAVLKEGEYYYQVTYTTSESDFDAYLGEFESTFDSIQIK